MTGQKLSHFEILDKLGEGGMGVVYKARDTQLDRPVAIKLLRADKTADTERRRRFIQEAKSASAWNHPNIVTIYEIGQANGSDFIAMEFIDGLMLDQLIPRKGMRLPEALKYSIQIADALAKAHSAGITHRDLKPSNIMVTADDRVKILDFGLAKLTERAPVPSQDEATRTAPGADSPKTVEGSLLGTVAYMSPAQAEGRPVDTRSDIFAFGSVLYEMASGHRAFQGATPMATLAAVINQEPKPLGDLAPGVPRELERLIGRCLRKDPARRAQHIADIKLGLEEIKEDSESGALSSASALSSVAVPAPGAPRPPRWLVPVLAGAGVLGAGAVWVKNGRPGGSAGGTIAARGSDELRGSGSRPGALAGRQAGKLQVDLSGPQEVHLEKKEVIATELDTRKAFLGQLLACCECPCRQGSDTTDSDYPKQRVTPCGQS